MIWLINNGHLVLRLFLMATVVISAAVASHYHSRMLQAQEEISRAVQARKKAESVTSNLITAVMLFNDIAKAAHHDRYQNDAESERRVVYIRQAIKEDACSAHSVPADVADSLRRHRERIRSASGNARSGRAAG